MKVDATEIEVIGTLQGEHINMRFDEDSVQHLMSQFIDLYNDPELAIIREYSTNALDSHIEAGNTAPIEVNLPSPLSPFLKIKDYGIGMDGNTIRDIYSKYGASTKRESNDFQGQLGLGCKSALTYTNQFTLTGIKNGHMTTVAISREENGGGSMTIVNESSTDQPNGVEIVIPTKTGNAIATKAVKFFQYWKPGTVLVNGVEPSGFESILKVSEDMFIVDGTTHHIVMGNVAYPVDRETLDLDLPYNIAGLFFVPIGAVNFTPSREALRMTPKTKAALEQLRNDFLTNREKAIENEIASAPNLFEAINKYKTLKTKVSSGKLKPFGKFKSRKIPEQFEFPVNTVLTTTSMGWNKKSEHDPIKTLHLESWPQTVFIKNWSQSRFTASTKKKLLKWLEQQKQNSSFSTDTFRHYEINNFVLIPEDYKQPLIPKPRVVDWEEIRTIKLDYNRGGAPKVAGTYDVYMYGTADACDRWEYALSVDDFPDYDMYYAVYDTYNKQLNTERAILKKNDYDEFMIVHVTHNRLKKFNSLYPHAINVREECRTLADKFIAGIDKDTLAAYNRNTVSYSTDAEKLKTINKWLKDHSEYEVEDPKLNKLMKSISYDLTSFQQSANLYGSYFNIGIANDQINPVKGCWKPYPLVDRMGGYMGSVEIPDVIAYLNFTYRKNIIDHCEEW